MKKYIILFLFLFLVSCGGNQSKEIDVAKQDLLQQQNGDNSDTSLENTIFDRIPEQLRNDITEPEVEIFSEKIVYDDASEGFDFLERDISELTCETITGNIAQYYPWFYWNTCVTFQDENVLSFNVLHLDQDQYMYERHYVNFEKGVYARILLEKGGPVTSEELSYMNQQLREKTFEKSAEYDEYFLGL